MKKRNLKVGFATAFGIAMSFMVFAQAVVVIFMYSHIGILGILVVIFSLYLYLNIINKFGDAIIKEREDGHTG